MKRVLLTGVAGFIGAHTLEHLLTNTDWFVYGVDSLEHRGDYRRIEQVLMKNPELWVQRFTFIKADLVQTGSLPDDIDYVINMASESHVDRSITDPVPFVKNNVDLMLTMLEYARRVKPEKFIQISTDEVYGAMGDHPFSEWERFMPSNPYSASKAMQEMLAISYWRTYGVPLVITNTMNNIGEMQDSEKFLPLLVKSIDAGEVISIHGSPEDQGSRFYLHARNHADAILFILNNVEPKAFESPEDVPDKFHIVGDTQVSNLELALKVSQRLGKPLKYKYDSSVRPGHDLHYGLVDNKLSAMGWTPPLGFEESFERTVDNYLTHKEWL